MVNPFPCYRQLVPKVDDSPSPVALFRESAPMGQSFTPPVSSTPCLRESSARAACHLFTLLYSGESAPARAVDNVSNGGIHRHPWHFLVNLLPCDSLSLHRIHPLTPCLTHRTPNWQTCRIPLSIRHLWHQYQEEGSPSRKTPLNRNSKSRARQDCSCSWKLARYRWCKNRKNRHKSAYPAITNRARP